MNNSPSKASLDALKTNSISETTIEEKYQHYSSARIAMRLITDKGKRIVFTGYEFLTQDEDIIEYLDTEIKQGLPGIAKGKLMTASESDPMEALRRKHIKEYEDQKAEEAANASRGITKNMGTTENSGGATVKPVTSGQVAN